MAVSLLDAVNRALDAGYNQQASPSLAALRMELNRPAVRNAFQLLRQEASRLQKAGEQLTPGNPFYVEAMRVIEGALQRGLRHADAAVYELQLQSAGLGANTTKQLAQLTGGNLSGAVANAWNSPDPLALERIVDYTTQAAWQAQFGAIPEQVMQSIQNQILAGVAMGKNPLAIAQLIQNITDTLPRHYLNTMLRTLQLTSYREAAAFAQLQNANILAYQLRVAALDDRTCLACISLSGTRLPLGQRIDDHHNGRCVGIPVVRGSELNVPLGMSWFDGLSSGKQQSIMGVGNYNAYQAGAVTLADFVREYHDNVFGSMVGQSPLKDILGSAARQYYGR